VRKKEQDGEDVVKEKEKKNTLCVGDKICEVF
jgi:hypothetical protein